MTLADRAIGDVLDDVASARVTPSGGAMAAVGGATGAALCEMVCVHTVAGAPTGGPGELAERGDALAEKRARLLALADEDAAAVDALQSAMADEDGSVRAATRRATEVPLETAEACLDVLEHAVVVTERGNPNAVPDGVTGALLAHAALEASVATVRANVTYLDSGEDLSDRAATAAAAGERTMERVLEARDR